MRVSESHAHSIVLREHLQSQTDNPQQRYQGRADEIGWCEYASVMTRTGNARKG